MRFAETVIAQPEECAWTPFGKDFAAAVIALVAERDEAAEAEAARLREFIKRKWKEET